MKTRAALIAALFAAASVASAGTFAADAEKAPAAEAPAAKAAPHSHMQDKTGIAPAVDAAPADGKPAAAEKKPSKKRHFHPRDAK